MLGVLHEPDVSHIWLVVTDPERFAGVCAALMQTFRKRRLQVEVVQDAPSQDVAAIRDFALSLFARIGDARLTLNVTCATKLIAFAFMAAAFSSRRDARVVYVDTEHETLEFLQPMELMPMRPVLDIGMYLRVNGFALTGRARREPRWRLFCQHLAQIASTSPELLSRLTSLGHEACNGRDVLLRDRVAVRGLADGDMVRLKCLLAQSDGLARLGPDGDYVEFREAMPARLLAGIWVELWVFELLSTLKLQDLAWDVNGHWPQLADTRQKLRNQFDVLALHRNRLLFIECKTGGMLLRRDQSERSELDRVLTRIDSLGSDVGGYFATRMLVSAVPLDDLAHQRARQHRIIVVDRGEDQFRSAIASWMNPVR